MGSDETGLSDVVDELEAEVDKCIARLSTYESRHQALVEAADGLAAATIAACDGNLYDTAEDEAALEAAEQYAYLRAALEEVSP